MTTGRRDGNEGPFNAWIRNHPDLGSGPQQAALSITDIDFVAHQYLVVDKASHHILNRQHILLFELKIHSATVPTAQHDTLNVLHQILSRGDKSYVRAKCGTVRLFYHGLHLLTLSADTPTNSDTIVWDRRRIDTPTLVSILRFEIDATSLKPREDRLHHKTQPALDETWLTNNSPLPATVRHGGQDGGRLYPRN